MDKSFELSSKKYKNGRRKFTAVLYKLQPPECVIDGVGTQYNKNGLTFLEEYSSTQLESIKDMSVTVSFLDEDRTQILDHGFTEMNTEDGLPTFDNATTIGHFTKGYIGDVEIDGETVRCVCGEGFLDEMRYHEFISKLDDDLEEGNSVEGSIEIYRDEEHESIVYTNGCVDEDGNLKKGRIPKYFIHSGWAMVMNPADTNSQLLELNENKNKEGKPNMTENEIMEIVQKAIIETNSVKVDMDTKVSELNAQIEEKDKTISELNASVADMQKVLDDMKKEQETYWEERCLLEKEIAKAKVAEKLGELDTALEKFSDEEKEVAKDDIDKLKATINSCEKKEELNSVTSEINSISSKICTAIVTKQKEAEAEAKVDAEQNSVKETDTIDIFSEVNSAEDDTDDDTNIF